MSGEEYEEGNTERGSFMNQVIGTLVNSQITRNAPD